MKCLVHTVTMKWNIQLKGNKMTTKVNVSEILEEMKPIWVEFIVDLGYEEKQGELFAEGYAEKLKNLPILEKMYALSNQHDECMTAGFEKANIDEDEAFERFAQ